MSADWLRQYQRLVNDRLVQVTSRKACLFWLRQLRRARRSLRRWVVKTLVRVFVASSVNNYCNLGFCFCTEERHRQVEYSLFWMLQLVWSAGSQKYKRGLSRLMQHDLCWLTVPQRLHYKLAVTVHRCLKPRPPRYLTDYCVPVREVQSKSNQIYLKTQ